MAVNRSGGAATAGGMEFQHRVSAWLAARILAEKSATPPWDLTASTSLEYLRCETEQPVDDIMAATSANGFAFLQVKKTLSLSEQAKSELASVIEQFVRQFAACKDGRDAPRPWARPLNAAHDRLVLVTTSSSSEPVRLHLPAVLQRVRAMPSDSPLDSAPSNTEERRVLAVIVGHLNRIWTDIYGRAATEADLREVLPLIRVQTLDFDADGAAAREAKDLLKSSVLSDAGQADLAWAVLVSACARFAATKTGGGRHEFQGILLSANLGLYAARSYQDDIQRLRSYSANIVRGLADLSRIRVGRSEIKIARDSTVKLRQAATQDSLLIVGEPGGGKSGALHDLAQQTSDEQADVVFLAVDRIAARSLGELRQELGLQHELLDVLSNWPGTNRGLLIIDALDAARAEPAARAIRELIGDVLRQKGRWNVVASIRKFDLRYGPELQEMFRGAPPSVYKDDEFKDIRHLNIPRLSIEEIAQVGHQSEAMRVLVERAPHELQTLLPVPFNIRLLAELLGAGVDLNDLTPIRTQLELLNQYWRWRVLTPAQESDVREAVLRKTCDLMVRQRILHVELAAVSDAGSRNALRDLRSMELLAEWKPTPDSPPDRYILAFSHHVLFDYAVARLLLRRVPADLTTFLIADPELLLVVRPSLALHCHHLWANHRPQFWDLVFRLQRADRLPEIGRLLGPATIVDDLISTADLEPLYAALEEASGTGRVDAAKIFGHVVGALQVSASSPSKASMSGEGARPWAEICERLSRVSSREISYPLTALIDQVCEHPEALTAPQRASAGLAARRSLTRAWEAPERDRHLVIRGIGAVCRSFESDNNESAKVLSVALQPEHLVQFGHEEMLWMTRELKRLIPTAPAFIEDVYKAVFGHRETSNDTTMMGSSRILSLTSNRRQDYGAATHQLADIFPQYLSSQPLHGTRAIMAVVHSYVEQHRGEVGNQSPALEFDFGGKTARTREDHSSIWDEGFAYDHHDELRMFKAFQTHLESLGSKPSGTHEFRDILNVIIQEAQDAAVWRRVLVVGAKFPKTLGKELLPLAWSAPILRGIDTTTAVGEYLKGIAPETPSADRERIERAILALPKSFSQEKQGAAERLRNRLVGCLPEETMVLPETRDIIEALKKDKGAPPNTPPFKGGIQWSSRAVTEEMDLEDEGVPVAEAPNRLMREAEQPVTDFAQRHFNSISTLDEAIEILPDLKVLHNALTRAEENHVHPKQRDYGWGHLSEACSRIARIDTLEQESSLASFTKTALLEASSYPQPLHHPELDAQFDEHPSWGSPTARIPAAEGLMALARSPSLATTEVLDAIRRLSRDPVPAVRFHIVSRLNFLYKSAPDLMWDCMQWCSDSETSRGVLQGLLSNPIGAIAGAHATEAVAFTHSIYERTREGPGAEKVREMCVSLLARLYIWRDIPGTRAIIFAVAGAPIDHAHDCSRMLVDLRDEMTHGEVGSPDQKQDSVRRRSFELFDYCLSSAIQALRQIESAHQGQRYDDWPEADQKSAREVARVIDRGAGELYFSSGAYDLERTASRPGSKVLSEEARRRFYGEAAAILDRLADVGLPSVSHHLLQTLESFIPFDPRGVFLRIGRVIDAGRQGGYQFESLAADLLVSLIERYLAEHRPLLREDEQCRRVLVVSLDTFVSAGWPSARRLAYRLEDIFR